jgi:hypothetical protein
LVNTGGVCIAKPLERVEEMSCATSDVQNGGGAVARQKRRKDSRPVAGGQFVLLATSGVMDVPGDLELSKATFSVVHHSNPGKARTNSYTVERAFPEVGKTPRR